jgi:hypothetical protein
LQKAKVVLSAERGHVLERAAAVISRGMRDDSTAGSAGALSDVSGATARTVAATADPVPAAGQPAGSPTCEKLAEDAAQTTLMLLGLQRWYREQHENNNTTKIQLE